MLALLTLLNNEQYTSAWTNHLFDVLEQQYTDVI